MPTYRVSFGINEGYLVSAVNQDHARKIALEDWRLHGIDVPDDEEIYVEEYKS